MMRWWWYSPSRWKRECLLGRVTRFVIPGDGSHAGLKASSTQYVQSVVIHSTGNCLHDRCARGDSGFPSLCTWCVHAIPAFSNFLEMTLATSGVHVGHGAKFVRVLCFFDTYTHDAHVASQYPTLKARWMQRHGSIRFTGMLSTAQSFPLVVPGPGFTNIAEKAAYSADAVKTPQDVAHIVSYPGQMVPHCSHHPLFNPNRYCRSGGSTFLLYVVFQDSERKGRRLMYIIGNRHARTYLGHLESVSEAHRVRQCEALEDVRQRAARGPTRLSRND
jgi:hypothetical protein